MNKKEKRKNRSWPDRMLELFALISEFIRDSDRSAVIVGSSQVDIYLERILKLVFIEPAKPNADNLFNVERPLSTFSAKIDLAYRLGILSDELAANIHLLRGLRNDAAHDALPFKISNLLTNNKLSKLLENYDAYEEELDGICLDMLANHNASPEGLKVRSIIIMILMRLEDTLHEFVRLPRPVDIRTANICPVAIWRGGDTDTKWTRTDQVTN